MPRLVLSLGADDPSRLAAFWAALLGREVTDGSLLAGDPGQLAIRVVPSAAPRVRPARMHLHLTSESADHQQQTVETALGLGATHVDVGQRPEEGHVVLADPEGDPFCVIEPGNRFLAGAGFLGEVACDGSRAVGVFWSEALGWPLVWDAGDETAVQSPEGGTKVAWGGGPEVAPVSPARQLLELHTADVHGEADRLVRLGARVRTRTDGAVLLLDPDGGELRVVRD